MSPRRRLESAAAWLRALARGLGHTARLAVGVPDYDTYAAHRREHHPDQPLMSYEEFFRQRTASRYRRGSSRCC
jgi:uncharacterized short protein YbdD (DUF466 family)